MTLTAVLLGCLLATAFGAGPPPKSAARSIPEWVAALSSRQDDEREAAERALGPDGPFAKDAVPALIDAFTDADSFLRRRLAGLAAGHGPTAVPPLLAALQRPEAEVRAGAATALGRVRPRPANLAHVLVAVLKDADPNVRWAAANALGGMRKAADVAAPALVTALGDSDADVRMSAADGLGRLVRQPGPAIPALARAVSDPSAGVREEATLALERIGPAARGAVPILLATFGDERPVLPAVAIGRDLPGPAPVLVTGTVFAGRYVIGECRGRHRLPPRVLAALALAEIKGVPRDAIPRFVRALHDPNPQVRRGAAEVLGSFGPDAAPAVPALLAAAKCNGNGDRRWSAIAALGKIGPAAAPAVPFLLRALAVPRRAHDAGFIHQIAAEALGGIGPAAREAVPALTAFARDRKADEQAREAAAGAVVKVDPAFAAKEGVEFAHLNIRLGRVPVVPLRRPPVGEDQAKRARALIAKLAATDKPDFGLSGTLSGTSFAPLPDLAKFQAGLITNHRLTTAGPFRELVEMGPAALPSLLAALDDRTPTKLTVRSMGMMFFGGGIDTNPFNPAERRVTSGPAAVAEPAADEDDADERPDSYTVTVGDICFVAVGQIVGRPYQAIRYIPSAIISVNSPTISPLLRAEVRAAWAGKDPARTVLDSLLIDSATEGVPEGFHLDGWEDANRYQIGAAVRLLYYFPEEAAPLVAARLRALDVSEPADKGLVRREEKNRVRTLDFVKAVAWCPASPIREALADIAKRTDDPAIRAAATGAKE